MTTGTDEAFEIFERIAAESGNRFSFYEGMVFGLAQALQFYNRNDLPVDGCINTLVDLIDERIFKPIHEVKT